MSKQPQPEIPDQNPPVIFPAPTIPSYPGNSNAVGEKFSIENSLYAAYLAQPAAQLIYGKIFGIGIDKAILKEELLKNNKTAFPYTKGFEPDAFPNGKNGYNATSNWDGYMSSSLPGMPVMCYLKLKGGSYTDLQGDVIDFPDIIFETVLITLTMGRDIKKTRITGRNTGTIKEYIGQGDWSIDIRAIITSDAPVNTFVSKKNQGGVYPRENMHQVWQMLQAPIAIPIECWFLQLFDINYIVIEEGVRIEQTEGSYSTQRLIIPAVSDHPLVISVI